jgi:ABC-2 type transport system ATP-binding protein
VTAVGDDSAGIVGSGLGLETSKGWVYRDVDLIVPRSALALVTGPAGCGKTALLLAVAARMRPSVGARPPGGGGRPAPPPPPRRLVGLGESAGVNDLDPTLPVAAQVKAELAMHKSRRGHSEVAAAFASVGLDVDPLARISDLHAADRLLLGVALAGVDQPPFLVVDDLHEDLTPDERELVLDRLRDLTRSGVTIVAGSLDPALASLADVVLALDVDGRPADGLPPADDSPTPHLEETTHALV